MFSDQSPLLIFSGICLSLGMVRAFFSGLKCSKAKQTISDSVWTGYAKGVELSAVFFWSGIAVFLVVSFFIKNSLFETSFNLVGASTILTLAGLILGLILYTPSAFFGYTVGRQDPRVNNDSPMTN